MMTNYNVRTWLNPADSPSTGNVVCYDGMSTTSTGKKFRNQFVSVADCNVAARIHRVPDDSTEDFIEKVKKLRDALDDFLEYLETPLLFSK